MALVALVVAAPVVAVVTDAPRTAARDQSATTVAAPDVEPAGEPVVPSGEAEADTPLSRSSARGPVRALFFGDSYFIGGGYTGEDDSMARLAGDRLGWVAEINGGGGTGFVQTNHEYGLGNYLDQIRQGAFDVGRRGWVVVEGGNNDVGQPLDDVRSNARRVLRIAQRRFPDAHSGVSGRERRMPDGVTVGHTWRATDTRSTAPARPVGPAPRPAPRPAGRRPALRSPGPRRPRPPHARRRYGPRQRR
jgi:hypothetical protein